VTRTQAYKRLAAIAFVLWALVAIAGAGPATGAMMAAAVLATGALAVELGLARRRRVAEERREE
jgi:hypothetical protein